jgi:hypothetical protein
VEGRRSRELEAGLSDRAGFPQGEVYKRGNLGRRVGTERSDRVEGRRSCGAGRPGEREIRRKGRERNKLTPDAV